MKNMSFKIKKTQYMKIDTYYSTLFEISDY